MSRISVRSSIRCRIIGLLSRNGLEDRHQSFYAIRYQSPKFPNMSKGATKPNFRVGSTMAGCCPTLKKGLVPLMAVIQLNKLKVHPVMDDRELNDHVDTLATNADVFAAKLRECRKRDVNVSLLDLRRAYLQICIDESLWPYQIVVFKGQRYCLMRLGFSLNMACLIMRSIVDAVMSQDQTVKSTMSAYINDIFINENLVSSAHVRKHLSDHIFLCKDQGFEWQMHHTIQSRSHDWSQ